jgi:platelet-activating factor acetylhydrolase IB subunit alpha
MDECWAIAKKGMLSLPASMLHSKRTYLFQLSLIFAPLQILELESRNTKLRSEVEGATIASLFHRHQDPAAWLPQSSARYVLESHKDTVNCIAFHPIFTSIASGSDDCIIKIWDWELGELERSLKGHTRSVVDLDYGGPRSGVLLASCSSDMSIKLWDPADEYKNVRTLVGHDHSVSAVRFISSGAAGSSYSGNLLVSASRDKTIRVWDSSTGYCVRILQGHTEWVRDVTPSFDGNFLLSADDDKTARLWDISLRNPISKVTLVGHDHVIECCAIAPPASYQHLAHLAERKKVPPLGNSAEFMATGSRDKTVKLWDAHGNCLKTLFGHDDWVRALVFHPGGNYIFSVSDDKSLRCWDLSQEGKCVRIISDAHERFVTCLKWAPGVNRPVRDGSSIEDEGRAGLSIKGTIDHVPAVQIRCVIATGSVDTKLKIYAS